MVEQTLKIYESEKINAKTGEPYKNIYLKTKLNKMTNTVYEGLTPGNHIIVQKIFAEDKEFPGNGYSSFACNVRYADHEVGFWLYDKDHEKWAACGGADDFVKIEAETYTFTREGKQQQAIGLKFSLVE